MSSDTLDEFYIWGVFESRNKFDRELWKNFRVATKFGRIRFTKYVRCIHCKREVGWSGCNGNLKKHLSRNHPEISREEPKRETKTEEEVIEQLIQSVDTEEGGRWKRASSIKRLGGKNRIWNLFSIMPGWVRYVRCDLCKREVFWNQSGLEKLKRHIKTHHLNTYI
jgi:hypothetical protein